MSTITRRELLERITGAALPLYGEREARSIAFLAVERLCGLSRADIALTPAAMVEITPGLEAAIADIGRGVPVQYVTGRADFFGLSLAVGPDVLIPRPETEELVAWVIESSENGFLPHGARILDIGTGSGAIAVALALNLPAAQIAATDISEGALRMAAANAEANRAEVALVWADILSEDAAERFGGRRFDAIVSNPPYIPESDRPSMHVNVTGHEPAEALFVPDGDPLVFYKAIARHGRVLLAESGSLFFEIYEHLADQTARMLRELGYGDVECRRDINGRERMIRCRRK